MRQAILAAIEANTEELRRAILAIEAGNKGVEELVGLARPTLAGHWGNGTMALAAMGGAAAAATIFTWLGIKPKHM